MSLPHLISRLAQIENTVSVLFHGQFDGMENDSVKWVIGPLDPTEVSNVYAWFDIAKVDFTGEVLQALFQIFVGKKSADWQDTSFISAISSRLQAVANNLQEGYDAWKQICEARQEIYLGMAKGGFNKEEIWRFRVFTEKAKDSLLKQITAARINLQEIVEVVEHVKARKDSNKAPSIRCPITGQVCDLPIIENAKQVFVGFQFVSIHYKSPSLKVMIKEALEKLNLSPFFADEHFEAVHISCEICHAMQQGAVCIFEISDSNPNVMFELGFAYMLGKFTILLARKGSQGTQIADIAGIHRIEYDDLVECRDTIARYLSDSSTVHNLLVQSDKEKNK
ncbi:MAG: hypothetical protein HZB51_05640 [Chloroflexi bacterium]|nr:hypothetical protein [Chloroflexota bacterium]